LTAIHFSNFFAYNALGMSHCCELPSSCISRQVTDSPYRDSSKNEVPLVTLGQECCLAHQESSRATHVGNREGFARFATALLSGRTKKPQRLRATA